MKKEIDSNVNIGCGPDLWNDVRLDIRRTSTTTIIADAQNLPFKARTFKDAKMSHALEHMHDPSKALRECLYVTRDKIMIAFPAKPGTRSFVKKIASVALSQRMVDLSCSYGWLTKSAHLFPGGSIDTQPENP